MALEVDLVDFQGLKAFKINLDSNREVAVNLEVIYLMNLKSSLGDRVDKREGVKEERRRERT